MRLIDAEPIIKNLSAMKTQLGYDAINIDGMIKALREAEEVEATQTPNGPLSISELREMDGEPVYLPGGECWVLVTFNGFASVFHWPDGSECSAADWCNNIGPAYRRKPEEG